jgi:hypothetical protein
MEKGSKKKAVKFDPSEYDYMDDMPLEGWIWEFVRRSDYYKEFHPKVSKLQGSSKKKDIAEVTALFKEFLDIHFPLMPLYPPDCKWSDVKLSPFGYHPHKTKLFPLKVVNLGIGYGVDRKYGEPISQLHPKITVKREEKNKRTVYIVDDYKSIEYSGLFKTKDGKSPVVIDIPEIEHPVEMLRKNIGKVHMVMALIDISSPKSINDLLKSLKRELVYWRKTLKLPKTIAAKTSKKKKDLLSENSIIWKDYLMIYDLNLQNNDDGLKKNDYSRIAKTLYPNEPNGYPDYSATKRVRKAHKTVTDLINDKYKDYLH